MLFLCLFYIRWNFGIYSAFIEFHIAFLKRNVIFFQAVRVVCLPILQGFFCNLLFSYFSFQLIPNSEIKPFIQNLLKSGNLEFVSQLENEDEDETFKYTDDSDRTKGGE